MPYQSLHRLRKLCIGFPTMSVSRAHICPNWEEDLLIKWESTTIYIANNCCCMSTFPTKDFINYFADQQQLQMHTLLIDTYPNLHVYQWFRVIRKRDFEAITTPSWLRAVTLRPSPKVLLGDHKLAFEAQEDSHNTGCRDIILAA